jgi:iron(III) transport system ATP-binding protein
MSGTRTALVGPSGSGKTTLLRCLAGLEPLDAGQVILEEPDAGIGFVFQDGALWPHMTALQHLRFAAPRLSASECGILLGRVGLHGLEKRRPAQLSGGERQRLALARALAPSPRLLLLDEPLRSVDVHLRQDLSLLIRHVASERGLTLVVVTHDRDEALALAEHVAVMRQGRIVEHGPALELLRAPRTSFTASFLGKASCFPATAHDGVLETALGSFPRSVTSSGDPLRVDAGPGAVDLVVLPGEARLASGSGAARGRVLHVLPQGSALIATVEVAGRALPVPVTERLKEGAEVGVELAGPPRFLPAEAVPEATT